MNKKPAAKYPNVSESLRKRAEKMLRTSASDVAGMSVAEIQKLVHELQVHQMELEIQNEDLRNAQVQLAQSRDRYSDLYEFAPVGYLTFDRHGVIQEANLTAGRMIGIERERLVGRKFSDFVAAVSQDDWHLHRRQVFAMETAESCELRMVPDSGSQVTFYLQTQAFRDEAGNINQFRMAFSDVSERNSLRKSNIDLSAAMVDQSKELEHSTEQLGLLSEAVSHLGEGILITGDDLDWPGPTILFVNEAMCRITGYDADELVGQSPRILQGSDTDREAAKSISTALVKNESCVIELVNYRKDGTAYDAELFITPLFDVQGHRTNFVSVHRDISQRKAIEKTLRREHELNESIIATSQQVVVVLDPEGRILQFNPYLEKLTGWSHDEVQGKDWFETFLPDAIRPRIREVHARAVGGERTRGNVNPILTKDGQEREITWHDAPLYDEDGELIGLLCCGQDVTERRMLERHILEISDEEQRRIGRDLHDGIGQEVLGQSMIADSLVIALKRASREESAIAKKLSENIMRTLAHVRALAHGTKLVDIDAHGLMSSLSEMAKNADGVGQVRCTFECDEPVLLRDNQTATQLFRISQEATTNALKHGKAEKIAISLRRTSDGASLRIVDDGVGIKDYTDLRTGMGMQTMHYRADIIGCGLQIAPGGKGGTEVVCAIPSDALYQA